MGAQGDDLSCFGEGVWINMGAISGIDPSQYGIIKKSMELLSSPTYLGCEVLRDNQQRLSYIKDAIERMILEVYPDLGACTVPKTLGIAMERYMFNGDESQLKQALKAYLGAHFSITDIRFECLFAKVHQWCTKDGPQCIPAPPPRFMMEAFLEF